MIIEEVNGLVKEGELYDRAAKANSTISLYQRNWDAFSAWCDGIQVSVLPASPEMVALYAAWLARRLKPATVAIHLCAIRHFHMEAGFDPPTATTIVRKRVAGIRRSRPALPKRKAPMTIERIDAAVDQLGGSLFALQRKALLMLGFTGGFRRSELVGLDVRPGGQGTGYIEFTAEGLDVVLTKSKTDQEGKGRRIAIPYRRDRARCPVRMVRDWLLEANIESGPIFRRIEEEGVTNDRLRPSAVNRAVKWAARRCGLYASDFGAHSLRAGFVTSAAKHGASISAIQSTTGHARVETVWSYVRESNKYADSALNFLPGW